ncbi:LysM peptidoglycan-binding domain-containing protein [Marisediminicola antarctica]|uniref:LysM domain-containing protein n=1 Tax=Marisediminicola antarctica TaxID=674079 RepID=A0A7L5AH05_9MICO|nr:LysM peptidoglycan-binding domain-containing protein [Marisediminicola antarctica]QHO69853.1 hypothetical protein BHD05_09575 [Marisediminicola antarctica]
MAEYLTLGPLREFVPLIPGAEQFLAGVDQHDLSVMDRVHVRDLRVAADPAGRQVISLALAVEGETVIGVPQIPIVSVLLAVSEPGFTSLRGRLTLGSGGTLQLYDLRLAIRLNQPLLRRYDLERKVVLEEAFTAQADATLTFFDDQVLRIDLYNYTIPPFMVGETGLVMALENCQLDLGDTFANGAIHELLGGATFHGVYAEKALLLWLPQFHRRASAEAGLRLELTHIAVDADGISFEFDHSWNVAIANGEILPASELRGTLFEGALSVALARATGRVVQNVPESIEAEAVMRLPLVSGLLKTTFSLEIAPDATFLTTALVETHPSGPLQIDLGSAGERITMTHLRLLGELREAGFGAEGQAGFEVRLPGLNLNVDEVEVRLECTSSGTDFSFQLRGLNLGPLGQMDDAELRVVTRVKGDGATQLEDFYLAARYTWSDLSARLGLASLPPQFPLPPDDATVVATIRWRAGALSLRFAANVDDPTPLWRFLPPEFRPPVRNLVVAFNAAFADAATFQAQAAGNPFPGRISASLEAQLPAAVRNLPGGLVVFDGGTSAEEWMKLTLEAGLQNPQTGANEPYMNLILENPIDVGLNFPFLPTTEPAIALSLDLFKLDVAAGGGGNGALEISGRFVLRPPQLPAGTPSAVPIEALFTHLRQFVLSGDVSVVIHFAGSKTAAELVGTFDDADLRFGILEMLGALAAQSAEPPGSGLDVEVGFGLKRIALKAGTIDPALPGGLRFDLVTDLFAAGVAQEVALGFSEQEIRLGIQDLRIPLAVPQFPLTKAEVDALRTDADWIAFFHALEAQITGLGEPRTSAERRALTELGMRKALLGAIGAIRERLGSDGAKDAYRTYTGEVCGVLNAMTSPFNTPNPTYLVIRTASFVLPLDNPSDLALEGTAGFSGDFDADPDHPLHWLAGIELGLGISPETVYFAFESDQPIPLPDLGRYAGGSVEIGKLLIGYGYTMNSLAFAFDGRLVLPPRFVEDLDTSDEIGFGIRPPRFTALSVKLDLIPVTLGAITFPAPMLRFDLDMRAPGSSGLASALGCIPTNDGLQLIAKGIYHDQLRRIAFSPLFTILPIPNVHLAAALDIGNARLGMTLVADDLLWMAGIMSSGTPIPIPFLADPSAPYFENLCVNMRVAGFGINFNLQRPFPSANPMIVFEVLGLLSDPLLELNPHGALASLLRVSLTDAVVRAPEWARQLFPALEGVVDKPLNVTLNLGDVISFFQQVLPLVEAAGQAADDLTRNAQALLDRLKRLDLQPDFAALMHLLPPELRKFRTHGAFAGFEARVVLLLITPEEAQAAFRARTQGPQPVAAQPLLAPDPARPLSLPPLDNARTLNGNIPAKGTRVAAEAGAEELLTGREFKSFTEGDLDALPPVPQGAAGVFAGAYVKVFAGQRFRFVGYLFDDGSFAFVSGLSTEPLRLSVLGIETQLPLRATARMELAGRSRRGSVTANLKAEGTADWRPLGGAILRVTLGNIPHVVAAGETVESIAAQYAADPVELRRINGITSGAGIAAGRQLTLSPARLQLHSDGKFALAGNARIALFNGAAEIRGWADVSQAHAFAGGTLRYEVGNHNGGPALRLGLACEGRIGPGPAFALAGNGSLDIMGQPFVGVRGLVTQDSAEFEATLDSKDWLIPGSRLKLAMRGSIDLSRRLSPAFDLAGTGSIKAGRAEVRGTGGIRKKRNGQLTANMEGELLWGNRPWLGGKVSLRPSGVAVSGHTRFALSLTPSQLPGGINVAGLYLEVDLRVEAKLDASALLARAALHGSWALGARLASATRQVLPLAMQEIDFELNTAQLSRSLVDVSGFKLLPFNLDTPDSVQIPIPTLQAVAGAPRLQVGTIDRGQLGVNDAVRISPWFTIESTPLVPSLNFDAIRRADRTIDEPLAYTMVAGSEVLDLPLNSSFTVWLEWEDGELRLAIHRPGRQPKKFAI